MRRPWRFFFDVLGIALFGAGLGYVVGAGRSDLIPLWAFGLLIAIVGFWWRYGPGWGGGEPTHKRREAAEREYQQRERWDSWSD